MHYYHLTALMSY